MNKNVLYYYFEHWGMGMGGCQYAALDDAARSFCFGKMPSIWLAWPVFFAAGPPGLSFSEDFTLPHRFQVDSTGFHMSIWSPPGLQVDLLWQKALPNFGQNPPGFQVNSNWTPNGPDRLHGLHSTLHQN